MPRSRYALNLAQRPSSGNQVVSRSTIYTQSQTEKILSKICIQILHTGIVAFIAFDKTLNSKVIVILNVLQYTLNAFVDAIAP